MAQTPNIGFEDGTFNHWECAIGKIDSLGNIHLVPSSPTYNRQTIIGKTEANVVDLYGKFPILCPNGSNYSIRLGNDLSGAEAERVTYTCTVPNVRSYSIIFNYAVVLENPNHAPYQQPKFTARVYDVSDDTYINCPSFDFIASPDLPGFRLSTEHGAKSESIYYKDWSTATIDLSGYIGKTIRLEFTTNDCTKGQHFGYAYLDVNDNSIAPISGNAYCLGQNSVTLYAPNGFSSYNWYDSTLSKQVGTGQSLTISPPPPDLTTYAVQVFPYLGLGCVDTLYTTVNKIDEGFKLNVVDTVYGCPGTGVDLTSPDITAGSSPGMTLSYFTDVLGTAYLYNPDKILTSGQYYIHGINKEGCSNILPVQVIVGTPVIEATTPDPVTFPVTVDISKTFTHQAGVHYSYYTNPEATISAGDYTAVQYSGTYYIKAVDKTGCISIVPLTVTVYPPPPFTVTGPNTFTPNNDGINDYFNLTLTGQITFKSISIYDRYGQRVYFSKSAFDKWNGTNNGHNVPVGTYYWVFDGIDNFYKTKVNRASSITILR